MGVWLRFEASDLQNPSEILEKKPWTFPPGPMSLSKSANLPTHETPRSCCFRQKDACRSVDWSTHTTVDQNCILTATTMNTFYLQPSTVSSASDPSKGLDQS